VVLYNPEAVISFPRYGIGIPSLDTRKSNTVKHLLDHPVLGRHPETWLLRDIPGAVGREDLERVHTARYIGSLFGPGLEEALVKAYELVDEEGNFNRYDPASAEQPLAGLLDDVLRIISGTYECINTALKTGFCYYLGGGMHHAHPDFGHGFCLLNDISVALMKAREEGLFRTAWIVDVDAHRGDGTAEIMAGVEDITALSIHMARGWPLDGPEVFSDGRANPAWFPGDVDIPVGPGEEDSYLPRLGAALDELDRKGRPDLVFVVGGVDPWVKDELPSSAPLQLTTEQMTERDRFLYSYFAERDIPSAWVSAGGYGRYSWEIHAAFLEWVLQHRAGQS